jgi:phosphopantetheine adenylyltransferase
MFDPEHNGHLDYKKKISVTVYRSTKHMNPLVLCLFNDVKKSSNFTGSDGKTVGNELDWEGC